MVLVGDNWADRDDSRAKAGDAYSDKQITVMNSRAAQLLAGSKDRWALAGDQLYVDFDLSPDHIPPGSIFQIGKTQIEVTALPHLGCHKFLDRFGKKFLRLVNSPEGRALNLRGINARVVTGGTIRVGQTVRLDK